MDLTVPIMVGVGLVGVIAFLAWNIWQYRKKQKPKMIPGTEVHIGTKKGYFDSQELQEVPTVMSGIKKQVTTGIEEQVTTMLSDKAAAEFKGEASYVLDDPTEDPFLKQLGTIDVPGVQEEMLNELTDMQARWTGRRTATPYGSKNTYAAAYEEVTKELADWLSKWEKRDE